MKKIALIALVIPALAIAACGGRSGENNETRPASGHGGAEHGSTDNV